MNSYIYPVEKEVILQFDHNLNFVQILSRSAEVSEVFILVHRYYNLILGRSVNIDINSPIIFTGTSNIIKYSIVIDY